MPGNALHLKKKDEIPIFHSDRGSLCSGNRYQAVPVQNKIQGSMSKAGYLHDNSTMESFFASMKKEYFFRREYATLQEIEKELFCCIKVFCNRKRLHSSLGCMSPVAYRMKEMGQRVG